MRQALHGVIWRIIVIAALWSAATEVQAHEKWADGTIVPAWVKSACCGPQDVHVIDSDDVTGPNKQGFYHVKDIDTLVPSDRVYDSLDGVTYVFYAPYLTAANRHVYCLFLSRGF